MTVAGVTAASWLSPYRPSGATSRVLAEPGASPVLRHQKYAWPSWIAMVTVSTPMAVCRVSNRSRHSVTMAARARSGWLTRTRFHRLVSLACSAKV